MKLPVSRPLYFVLKILGFPVIWEVSIGSILFRETPSGTREYLILHYPSGHFDFPKGHVEAGESEEETLRRETEEETGIRDLTVYSKRFSTRYFYQARGSEEQRRREEGRGTWIFKLVYFYPAKTQSAGAVKISHEHIGALWLSYEAAVAKATFENAKHILRETEAYMQGQGRQSGEHR